MRLSRLLFSFIALGLAVVPARADDPVTVELRETATVGRALVTLGDVATLTGGDASARASAARLDLAELTSREPSATIGRRAIEYRLALAGAEAHVTGAARVTVTVARRPLTVEEVTVAARAELLRFYVNPADPVTAELASPIVVKLPEVPSAEHAVITGKPRGAPGALGPVQMDMSISAGGETLLSFPVYFTVRALNPVQPAGGFRGPGPSAAPASGTARFAPAENLIQPHQRVQMEVHSGALLVTAVGEAQQAGKLGQTIPVQNVDSKKVISGRVTGPGTVEIDLGGAP
jgi:flagellar basal body P-ring formation protein FlgA